MAECDLCALAEKGQKIYEDAKCVAVLHPAPAIIGHVVVMPRNHFTIIEQVPDFIVAHMAAIANKVSVALFDILHAQGTNIIIANGLAAGQKSPHFAMQVIPRFPNDGLSFAWQPKTLPEDVMSSVELKVREDAKKIGEFEKEKKEPLRESVAEAMETTEEDYLIKQLKRIP